MNSTKKWYISLTYYISVIVIFVMIGMLFNFFTNKKGFVNIPSSSDQSDYPGYSIDLTTTKNVPNNSFNLNMSGKKIFDYNVKFNNNLSTKNSFVMTTYVDYKQISFQINGNPNKVTSYNFGLNSKGEITIPTRFSIGNISQGNHVLLFVINDSANRYALNMKSTHYDLNIVGRYNLIIHNDLKSAKRQDKDKTNILKLNKSGLYLNENINTLKNHQPLLAIKRIKAKPGERIKIPVIIGNFKGTLEYKFWITMNWRQIKFDDRNNYWDFTVPAGFCGYKEFEVTAPKNKGNYEMIGFLALNPSSPTGVKPFVDTQVFTSQRFTLVVN